MTDRCIIGTDEVGRGCLAGPVVAAAVLQKPGEVLVGCDSKSLSAKKRKTLCTQIECSCTYALASKTPCHIDEHNILQSSLSAMKECVETLIEKHNISNPIVYVDGHKEIPGLPYEQHCIVKGDEKMPVIGAASILAKVYRDDYMTLLDYLTSEKYNFKKHKGYPTKEHYEKIKLHGISEYHRKTFKLNK